MKHRGKNLVPLLGGILIGALLVGPMAQAASEYFQAQRTPHPIYVDGQQVQMETYAINGHNYVKLRDIGEKVGFEVYWDGSAAQIVSDKPYTGMPPVQTPAPSTAPVAQDYSTQANPAIFTGELTQSTYNSIHGSLLNRDQILAGVLAPTAFEANLSYDSQLRNAVSMLGQYPQYRLNAVEVGQYRCDVQKLDIYNTAVQHTQPFVDSLSGMRQAKQAEEIAWYVCDRLTYAIEYPFVDEVLSQDDQVRGCCMAYAYCFQFLCDRVGIPCVLTSSETHQWNQVYIDGAWWSVDVTGLDMGNNVSLRPDLQVLKEASALSGKNFVDGDPQATAFAKELLVPGSTK